MKALTAALLGASLSLLCGPVLAEQLVVPDGMWEMTMTRTDFMGGPPVTTVTSECLQGDAFDPREMMKGMGNCQVTRQSLAGNRLDYAMECEQEGAVFEVDGSAESGADQGEGVVRLKMDAGGMTVEMDMTWKTRRLGDC